MWSDFFLGSMWLDADQCGGICDNFPDPLSLTRCCCCHVDILFFANLDIYSCFWQNSSFDKWAGFSQVWCHCCSPAIVRQTFRGSGNVTEDQQLSRALPRGHDEDKWHGIDYSPPLISQAHDWKRFHPSHRNISADERILRRAILLAVCASLSSLRQSAAFCWVLPKQLPTPFGHANLCFAQGSFL